MDIKLKEELSRIIKQSPISNDLDHAVSTLKWLLNIKPDSDIALQIAAFGHDIERGVNKITEKDRPSTTSYNKFKQLHADRSAEILSLILIKNNFDQYLVDRVKKIVQNHEFGGDAESDLIKDADSIAYFELNIPIYFERNGEEKTRKKIQFMYNRASKIAQNIIREMSFNNVIAKRLIEEEIKKN